MNVLVLHVNALKIPSGAALTEGVFLSLRLAAEKLFSREDLISFNGQQEKKNLTKCITNLISFGQVISATRRICIFWCSQMNMSLLHSELV